MGKRFCSSTHCYPPPSRGRGKTGLPAESHQSRDRGQSGVPGAKKLSRSQDERYVRGPSHIDFRAQEHNGGPGALPERRGLKAAAGNNRLMKPFRYPRLISGEQGAAALEFALVAPLFLLLWFGIMDFGLAMYAKGLITHASQEGARYGTIYHLSPPTAGNIQGYVQSYLSGAGFSQPVTITVTGAGGVSGTPLAVRVDYTYHFLGLPSFLAGWADSLNLSAESVKRLE